MTFAPIIFFVYNRPKHTKETVEALTKNVLASKTDLYIFSDGPKDDASKIQVEEVRSYVKTITGFKSIKIIERTENWGLSKSIIAGVTEIVGRHGRVIVLEDDLVTSPYFLEYMNTALDLYALDERVISIHGYVYPVKKLLPETFFLKGADCWGWATWKRGWDLFQSDGKRLLDMLEEKKLINEFDFNGAYHFSGMLKRQIAGQTDSWAIRWYASAFLAEKLTLYPGKSLVNNIGQDGSGVHGGALPPLPQEELLNHIRVMQIDIGEDKDAKNSISRYFRMLKPGGFSRFIHLLKRMKRVMTIIAKRWLEPVLQIECKISSLWVSQAHKRLKWIQWRLLPQPEHFDHQIDLYYQWLQTRNPFWLERGIFSNLVLKGGEVLELACGDGFNARNFYSLRSQHVTACDFDPAAIRTAMRKNSAMNIKFMLNDIRQSLPDGLFDNIIWDAAIEHFTPPEINAIISRIKSRLKRGGIVSGYTIVERQDGKKSLSHHEYEFKDKQDLQHFFTPYFKNVTVFETVYPNRHNLYFWASDGVLPFMPDWPHTLNETKH